MVDYQLLDEGKCPHCEKRLENDFPHWEYKESYDLAVEARCFGCNVIYSYIQGIYVQIRQINEYHAVAESINMQSIDIWSSTLLIPAKKNERAIYSLPNGTSWNRTKQGKTFLEECDDTYLMLTNLEFEIFMRSDNHD